MKAKKPQRLLEKTFLFTLVFLIYVLSAVSANGQIMRVQTEGTDQSFLNKSDLAITSTYKQSRFLNFVPSNDLKVIKDLFSEETDRKNQPIVFESQIREQRMFTMNKLQAPQLVLPLQ